MDNQIKETFQGKRYMFTYQLEDDEIFEIPEMDYLRYVYQEESAPTTGQLHIQGYFELKKKKRFSLFKDLWGDQAHFTECDGNWKACYLYCTKVVSAIPNGQRAVFGEWDFQAITQGKRNDLITVANEMKKKRPLSEIVEEFPTVAFKYARNLEYVYDVLNPQKKRQTTWDEIDFRWYFGPSGLGKSYSVRDEFGVENLYKKKFNNKWWDGYKGENVVLVDDYRKNNDFAYADLLSLLDVYEFNGEIKGMRNGVQVVAECIVITSNQPPWEIFKIEEADPTIATNPLTPLARRCEFYEFASVPGGVFCNLPMHLTKVAKN